MANHEFEDLAVGQFVECRVLFLKEKLDAFKALTGDNADLHQSVNFARRYGFKEIVVHGLLVQSPLSALLGKHLPGPRSVINTVSTKFHAPTYVGEEVHYVLCVARLTPAVQAVLLEYEGTVLDKRVISGTALCTFVRPSEV